ncbi:SHOCT domain-containing protein [Streptomyces indicus]|uniref:Short C-terminal domain-containing protein n=1 Tax=Streptomyces indicus TaxID=417292 RepID=A0A1G9H204_9ACTN|nr:SHOCT domain-containing protein [Streptomyces indicus]SDL06931.1 Short C-terminal domain-containing protein [Streptomyces indicus]
MPQRFGRPGLLGTIARTAVISGTASAVSNRVNRGMAERDLRRQAEQQAYAQEAAAQAQAQQWAAQPPQPAPPAPAPAPAAAPAAPVDRVAQLTALADLKAQGLLTDEEFAAEKARVLNS